MKHIGNILRQHIENQHDTINNFSEKASLERQHIYQDIKREDLNTRRLRIYLPALGITFSDFFKDFENEIDVFERNKSVVVNKSNNETKNEISSVKDYYEKLLTEKDNTINAQKMLIEVLQNK